MSDQDETRIPVEVDGLLYEVVPQPIRVSLSDDAPSLWGLQVHVLREGELLGIKTCFVGRVTLYARAKDALDGGMDLLAPVIHEVVREKVAARLAEGETGDEILFA